MYNVIVIIPKSQRQSFPKKYESVKDCGLGGHGETKGREDEGKSKSTCRWKRVFGRD